MEALKIASVVIVVLGFIIVGVGWHSYFASPWNIDMQKYEEIRIGCNATPNCPPLTLEQYFVSISFFTLVLSIGVLIGNFGRPCDSFKRVAPIYNAVAGLLLFIGGITLIVSAVQVHNLLTKDTPGMMRNDQQYYDEKIAAGALSFIAAIIYGTAALLGFKSNANLYLYTDFYLCSY